MTSNYDVAKAFVSGRKATAKNMYTDGEIVYSYGSWFPLAAKIRGVVLLNTDWYSSSTAKHQYHVIMNLKGSTFSRDYFECTTEEINRAIASPDQPIILTKEVNPQSIDGALEVLKTVCKEKGMKRFKMKKIKEFLTSEMV